MPSIAPERYLHVVAALIRDPKDPNRFIVTRRQKGQHLEDLWEFPGGKVETGESRFQALNRELYEEIGIRVIAASPYQSLRHHYSDKKIFLDVWEVTEFEGDPHGREGQQMQWVSTSGLEESDFPEADAPILAALTLPNQILVTPDLSTEHEDAFVLQFANALTNGKYRLIQFRSHHLHDKEYARIAGRLADIADEQGAEIVISRPSLKSLQSSALERFRWRHLNSRILHTLTENPFPAEVQLSASCHDLDELKMAKKLGCQFCLLSCIRETPSHPGRTPKGWFQFKNMLDKVSIPVYALGGVRRRDHCVARYQGAIGVAGITDFWFV